MSIGFASIEHAAATVAHEIVVGARATVRFLDKAATTVKNDAPALEALTSQIDPRAAVIERVGAALIGQFEPQIARLATDTANTAATPTVTLTEDLVAELKVLYVSMAPELATAKAAVKTT